MHVKQMFDLTGKVAIVTGASSGLGEWFARGLAEAGADVVLAARRLEKLESLASELNGLGIKALPVATDVSQEPQVEAMVDTALKGFGKLDVLINNAGIGFLEEPLESLELDILHQTFDVNFFGLWYCCKHAGRVMLERSEGKVINIASIEGLTANSLGPGPAYCASKGAVVNLSRELAKDWAPRGVKVHCVAPGFFPTEMMAEDLEDPAFLNGVMNIIPLGRGGTEDDIKGLGVFLASPASDFLLGHPIIFDGGTMLV